MSLMTREDMLRELELLPVWQLRGTLPAQIKPQTPLQNVSTPQIVEYKSVDSQVEQQGSLEVEVIDQVAEVAPVLDSPVSVPLRLLISEDSAYAFLLATSDSDLNAQDVETLLRNMFKAMQVTCRIDLIDKNLQQLAANPFKVIVAMGEVAANTLLGKALTVAEWRNLQNKTPVQYEATPVIVTYHPAHLLQHMTDKAKAWQDLCLAKKALLRL